MRGSAIRTLKAATEAPIVAAALFERTVQIWNWYTGERGCEFETVTDGGSRLSISPSGNYLVAANWRKGKRGGVACYCTKTGQEIWHRLDIRRARHVRFACEGASIWCGIDGGSLQQLDALTGETLASMRGVEQVLDSPYSDHRLVISRHEIRIKNTEDVVAPRLSFAVLDAAYSEDALCISEAGNYLTEARGIARCMDLGRGLERWRYLPPKSHHLIFLSYNQVDHCFYGTQWMYERLAPYMLVRLTAGIGAFSDVCRLNTYPDCCCFADGVVVTSSGDVVSLESGKTIRRLEFPECDYPDPPTRSSDAA